MKFFKLSHGDAFFNDNTIQVLKNANLVSVHPNTKAKGQNTKGQGEEFVDAKKGDLVYFDPPYQPVTETANFTSYTSRNFTYDDLNRLANLCMKLDSKGCNVLLSNSNSKEVVDMFSNKPWKISKIRANRSINSNSNKRTGHFELLIKNY